MGTQRGTSAAPTEGPQFEADGVQGALSKVDGRRTSSVVAENGDFENRFGHARCQPR